MKTVTYTDLYEDWIAEILRELPHNSVVEDGYYSFYPACAVCEDGIYSSGSGLYSVYINGKRTGSHVGKKYLIDRLAHKTFTVITWEEAQS